MKNIYLEVFMDLKICSPSPRSILFNWFLKHDIKVKAQHYICSKLTASLNNQLLRNVKACDK
jgi:hypothetical protein